MYRIISFLFALFVYSVGYAQQPNQPTASTNSIYDSTGAIGNKYADTKIDPKVMAILKEIRNGNNANAMYIVKAANSGNVKACNVMGWLFDNGMATKKDSAKALKWFESCASKNPLAAYNAGVLYWEGRGVAKNEEIGAKYFKFAWKNGGVAIKGLIHQIPIRLAYYYRKIKSYDDAWEWADKASQLNARHGKYLLARMVVENKAPQGASINVINYLLSAIESYSGPAAGLLSYVYGSGLYTEKDPIASNQYGLIANAINKKNDPISGKSLDEPSKKKAEMMAASWLSTHKEPKPMDFASTLSGDEPQFGG